MSTNLPLKKIVFGIASLLAVMALLLAAASPAYAGAAPIPAKNITDKTSDDTLKAIFRHDRIWLSQQRSTISNEKLKPMRDAFQNLMAKHKESASQIELHKNAFENYITRAEDLQELTKSLLADHNGFDQNGNVLDREAAIATLRTIETHLNNANYWIKSAKNEVTLVRRLYK